MHISEGILSFPVLLSGWVYTGGGLFWTLKKLSANDIPKMALLAAVFFVASLIHVPLGPSSVHLLLNGLIGVLLGSLALPTLFISLFLQAILFQFGGITVLGINTLLMSLPAILAGVLFKLKPSSLWGGILSGFAVLGSGVIAALVLSFSGEAFLQVAKLILIAHLPIAIIETIIGYFTLLFIFKTKPGLILNNLGSKI